MSESNGPKKRRVLMFGKLGQWLLGIDAGKVFDTVANGIDKLNLTEQEKAELHADNVKAKIAAISRQSIARRIVAIVVTFNFVLLADCAIGLYIGGLRADAEMVFRVLKELFLQPFNIIIGFYFLVDIARKVKGG